MNIVKASIGTDKYKTSVIAGKNSIVVDEPLDKGGLDLGFQPQELLAASLASCTAITLKMYADHKEWTVNSFQVDVMIEQSDDKSTTKFVRKISFEGKLDEKQHTRIVAIANACPIHKILLSQIAIDTILV
ncbi:OsmC family protein [Sphingobacterium faecium]|jgi:putative redox protein|uniref:OsmC family protein n=1 Tax=Sphingobacterium faecium TaxID=34087 RepID=UPI00097E90DC|nr:OsmC family protein [Sphingobacterium faecium]PTX10301.1 putative redox protein [Sphingobacterium faecium]WGQ14833.1 OsmC family protein [Sphingobacterium faecium]GEM64394.1 OsmC-related redox protein [Sphingobacterium faecium NBRC 15299]SJN37682.1 Predicted redox protein, regulator of disulfide bond formation [Sphingobacterium faecium PCAi_F2.5]